MKKGKRSLFLLFCLIFMFISSPFLLAQEAELKNIRFTQKDERLEVILEVSGDFGFETFSLIGPKRLVIDLSPVRSIKALPSISVNACGVIRIRCGQFKPEVARVVFDLAEKIPSHKISRMTEGLQVLFWQEEEIPAAVVVPEVKEEAQLPEKKPIEKTISPIQPTTSLAEPRVAKRGHFFRFHGGLSFFPATLVTTKKDLILYGETGSFNEEYKATFNLAFGLSAAQSIKLKEKEAKMGAEFSLWSLSHKGSFIASLPHPFTPNTLREFTFQEKLSNSLYQISVFFLYPLINQEKANLWLGPAIGYAFGKLTTLEDFNIEERPPYSGSDILLTDSTLVEDSVGDFIFELRLEFNYALTPKTLLVASTAISYFNPKVNNLGKRAKFISFPFNLGLEFRF